MKKIKIHIIVVFIALSSCTVKKVAYDMAPKVYIIEKIEKDQSDIAFNWYYGKSIYSNEYFLTIHDMRKKAFIGDTVVILKYRDMVSIVKSSCVCE